MTEQNATGASPAQLWRSIDWNKMNNSVRRLQMRIAKAIRDGRYNKAKSLQYILSRSHSAKLLAIKQVTSNKGRRTAGVDGIIWNTDRQKWLACKLLSNRGYKASPLKRIYIPKKNGKKRPLGIPTFYDRAMQAIHLMGLLPFAETLSDKHSYGFRPKRSCHDAIGQCFNCLNGRATSKWVLEGDIKGCFDNISHGWLLKNIPINKAILKQWLKAGFIFNSKLHRTESGTPQGGIISPTLANMVLDGIENEIGKLRKKGRAIGYVRYADDFIVTSNDKAALESEVLPAINSFFQKRGLSLSEEKTRITHIQEGFDFLGYNLRQYEGKLLIKPSKSSIKSHLSKIKSIISNNTHLSPGKLILLLNPVIRGWCNYYRNVVSKKIFSQIDSYIVCKLFSWMRKRHPNKSKYWRSRKYFSFAIGKRWVFQGNVLGKGNKPRKVELIRGAYTEIVRHVKIRSDADIFNPKYFEYFKKRGEKYAR